jgi:peroxiredoxin
MKFMLLTRLLVMAGLLGCSCGFARETNDVSTTRATNDVSLELRNLVFRIQGKLDKGLRTEADLAEDIKDFDSLLAKHKDEKTDKVAQVLMMKAKLYLLVLGEPEKAIAVFQQVQRDLPETSLAQKSDAIIQNINELIAEQKRVEAAQRIQATLQPGAKFPDFEEKDIADQPLATTQYKGKVVLVDFWATWCMACMLELPNVLNTYEKFHPKGLEIIGINLDDDKNRVSSFIKQKNITWQQFFDGKGWTNKLATKYGVMQIPATFLLDGDGKIIARDLKGPDLEQAVSKALVKD